MVMPCDGLVHLKNVDSPSLIVFNTKPADHPGSHWNVLYVRGTRFEWYDPAGLYLDEFGAVKTFAELWGLTLDDDDYDYDDDDVHHDNSCGHWVLVYCLRRALGWEKREIVLYPPSNVVQFVNRHFGLV